MTGSSEALQFPHRIGLGTWRMGESRLARGAEVAAISHALQVGYRLLDTAELYGEGGAERLIGQALRAAGPVRREELFIVSKVKPNNASRHGTVRACEASIERMGCDYLDLYLLHWCGPHRFTETLQGFDDLRQRGLIRHFGVSNFDVAELDRWRAAEQRLGLTHSAHCNQVFYCLQARGVEFDLLPWQRTHTVQTMAYSPLGGGALVRHPLLMQIAATRGATAAQLALAWCVRAPDVVAVPKSVDRHRIDENWQARNLRLTAEELGKLDQAFPPPHTKQPLATA